MIGHSIPIFMFSGVGIAIGIGIEPFGSNVRNLLRMHSLHQKS
jgi:hypothetical protein